MPGARPHWLDAEKKSLVAAEQDPAARAAWEALRATLDAAALVVIDETRATIALTRRYARAPRDRRAVGRVPRNHGTGTTLVAALTPGGIGPALTLPGALDGAAWRVFVRDLLVPALRPGQTVVLDNLTVHKNAEVLALIAGAGCRVLFLPAYSPDYSPIELAFSKLKALLRAAAARTQDALDQAIADALDRITPAEALAWFRHCGLRPAAQSGRSVL